MRYSIRKVMIGFVPNVDMLEDEIALILPESESTIIGVVDWIKREVIDIFEPENRYPILGREKKDFVEANGVDENKEYALKIGDSPYSFIDSKRIIRSLKNRGIIEGNKVTICNATIGKCVSLEKTGRVYDGKAIHEFEFSITKNCVCTVNYDETIATDPVTQLQYPILKRDETGRLSKEQNIEQDREYVVSILDKNVVSKKKLYKKN